MTSRLHRQRSLFHNIATGNRRVPHVRPSVRGPKMMGAAQRSLSLHRSPGWTVQQSHQVPQEIQGSEVEGSAVRPSALPNSSSKTSTPKQKCHPNRSVAKPRDLQFYRPVLEMFPAKLGPTPINLQTQKRPAASRALLLACFC